VRAINAVIAADKTPLQNYPLTIQSAVKPAANYLINTAMRFAVREGTGRGIYNSLPASLDVAGKTGTTDDLRDSWFAGFTEDRLGVVWIGRDDNKSSGLTGSSGALRVWSDLFSLFDNSDRAPTSVEGVEYQSIDPVSGLLADSACPDTVQLPFIEGSAPQAFASCARGSRSLPDPVDWFKELFH